MQHGTGALLSEFASVLGIVRPEALVFWLRKSACQMARGRILLGSKQEMAVT